VVDSNDKQRMFGSGQELHRLLKEPQLRNAAVLILANKQDLPHALTIEQVRTRLQMEQEIGYPLNSSELEEVISNSDQFRGEFALPDSILSLIIEYLPGPEFVTAPEQRFKLNIRQLQSLLNVKFKFMKNMNTGLVQQSISISMSSLSLSLICDYLGDILHVRGPQTLCHIQGTCATTGDGIYEGLDWLSQSVNKCKQGQKNVEKGRECVVM
jgi:hypothetical protein